MKKLASVILSLAILGLGGCDVFLGPPAPIGKGSLVIGFGEGGARSVLSDEEEAALRYDLVLTGPGGESIRASLSAGETFNEQVALGEWTIKAEAFNPEDTLIGNGTTTVTVRAGNNQARVPMRVIPAGDEDEVVTALDLSGLVTAPVKNGAPDGTEISADQYTGTIAWKENDGTTDVSGNFAAATVYQAVVTLTAKSGFTFDGVAADSFTYTGATSVTNLAGNGGTLTVTITFPATAAPDTDTTVSGFNLTALVTAPVRDQGPDATPINETQYTGNIAWQLNDGTSFSGPAFAASTVYKALVTLTARTGFTFDGVGADSFTHNAATSVSNAAGSGTTLTVTITFPETGAAGGGTGSLDISLAFNDDGSGAFSQGTFTVKQNGTLSSQNITLVGTWASREWRVDGVVKDTGTTVFMVNATDYTVGGHTLQVTVGDGDNHQWSKTLPFTVTAAVTGVSLNKNSLSLPVTGTETLYAAVNPANAENRTVSWASDNTATATVSTAGVVTGVSAGTATITVTTNEGGHTAACTVTVTAAGSEAISLGFTDAGSGAFSQDTFTVKQNGTPPSQNITLAGTWTSQEWRVDGVVKDTGQNFTVNATDYTVGGHSLQVTVYNGSTPWSKTLPFTVTAAVTGVSLNKNSLSLLVNGTETLYAALVPANAENRNVTWASSDTAIATVNNGVVTAKAQGTATITVTTTDGGHTAACTVTVGAAQNITLGFTDAGSGAFSQETFTISKGAPGFQTITLEGTWASQEWRVDGVVKGNGTTFTVNATDYTVGGHSLQVTVSNGTGPWSKTLQFTVTE